MALAPRGEGGERLDQEGRAGDELAPAAGGAEAAAGGGPGGDQGKYSFKISMFDTKDMSTSDRRQALLAQLHRMIEEETDPDTRGGAAEP